MNNPANLTPGGAPRKHLMRTSRVRRGLVRIVECVEATLSNGEPAKLAGNDLAELRYALEWCREQATRQSKGAKPKEAPETAKAA